MAVSARCVKASCGVPPARCFLMGGANAGDMGGPPLDIMVGGGPVEEAVLAMVLVGLGWVGGSGFFSLVAMRVGFGQRKRRVGFVAVRHLISN